MDKRDNPETKADARRNVCQAGSKREREKKRAICLSCSDELGIRMYFYLMAAGGARDAIDSTENERLERALEWNGSFRPRRFP